ncbi:MAG: response regulator [Fibrobacter sp.]|nr:response regulator [Fibrobacter sp.]
MKILIADDNYASRRLLNVYLKDYGSCVFATNGLEAIQAFELAHRDDPFDLICLDIMMPEMDGMECLRRIRRFEVENNIPEDKQAKIIMTTALDDRKDIIDSFNEGCEAYLIKPVEEAQLTKVLVQLNFKERNDKKSG